MEQTIIKEYKTRGFNVVYSYQIDEWESPNNWIGNWEHVDHHEAGTTVQNPNAGRDEYKWYVNANYTPAELAKDYAGQGRTNPSGEAYDSLQKELLHDLYGTCYTAIIEIKRAGIVLATDCIGSDYSDWSYPETSLEDEAVNLAKEHFSIKDLLNQARIEAGKIILQLN